MFGVAFELYQGSGVAGRVAWLALVLLSPLGGVGCAPAPPFGCRAVVLKLSERWDEIALVRGPVGIHVGSSARRIRTCAQAKLWFTCVCLRKRNHTFHYRFALFLGNSAT